MEEQLPAAWGFAGAFMYAAPKLLGCLYVAREAGKKADLCWLEALVALAIGTIAAAGVTPWLQEFLGRVTAHDGRAIALVVGMVANRVSPMLVEGWSKMIVGRVTGSKPDAE